MNKLNFDGRVAIVTGAGGGLGRAYALLLASRGCAVVVNDLGGSLSGEGSSRRAADIVVKEIIDLGGKAIPNYESVENGDQIVKHALQEFGRLDILINNAGILRDKTFLKINDQDWDLVFNVHVYGTFKLTKSAWNIFQNQKYGRIIMTTSAAGLYGNYGQTNYAAAKMALVGFGKTLAKEGEKKNIFCNIIAPVAGSRITETVLPPDLIEKLKPEYVAPFVAYLCHESSGENGSIYEIGAGFAAKVRWERSQGALLKVDDPSFTPAAVSYAMKQATLFSNPQYPQSMNDTDWVEILKKSKNLLKNNETSSPLTFNGRVALITGAGGGIGKGYALLLGKLGAKVVVNDLGKDKDGNMLADLVTKQIKMNGGEAFPNYDSVENGDEIISKVLKKYERIDILINNAGILWDKSFAKMTEQEWNLVLSIHLRGTFKVTKAAWPYMIKQNYGRIINTSSAVGLYGNFGQANYSAAKAGIIAFSTSLAAEGKRYNILINVIAPNAGTAMTATILPKDIVDILKPEYIAPIVGFLCHESNNLNGMIFEVGSGWFSQVRWQKSNGYKLDFDKGISMENVLNNWEKFNDFGKKNYYPKNAQESFSSIVAMLTDSKGKNNSQSEIFEYNPRDVILYNLGVGCTEKELKYVYEKSLDFSPIPTFGVIPAFVIMMETKMEEFVNNFNPTMLLHGEHFLQLIKTFPKKGKLRSEKNILQVLSKGKNCVLVIQLKTFDENGNLLAINEGTIFLRDATPKEIINKIEKRQKMAMEMINIPDRKPDKIISQKIPNNQAAIYRLSGDYNPLHVDSSFAKMGGFPKPILHGLCSYGHAAQHILKAFAKDDPKLFKAIKARFVKHVFPGETLQTEMWQITPTRIIFQVRVMERNEIVINNAFVELNSDHSSLEKEQKLLISSINKKSSKSGLFFSRWENIFDSFPNILKEEQIKKVDGSFQFEIKNENNESEFYYIDLKNSPGKIGKGKVNNPDITIIIKDADFLDLARGKMNGQQAFMKGKVQIRGNMMLAMKLDVVLKTLSNNMKLKI